MWQWGATRAKVTRCGPNVVRYEFHTALQPPIEWLRRVACRFPKLFFELVHARDGHSSEKRTIFIGSEVTYHLAHLQKEPAVSKTERSNAAR